MQHMLARTLVNDPLEGCPYQGWSYKLQTLINVEGPLGGCPYQG